MSRGPPSAQGRNPGPISGGEGNSRSPSPTGQKLVCLLPARNCQEDLPGFFGCVGGFVDAVVALDDGSSDGTADVLASQPLVKVLLRKPVRDGYHAWDDAANRNRLLAAASELHPDWIISLDADERIDGSDAAALREFIERDALPGVAYGFLVFRMIGDLDHYDRADFWVYRLFAFEPGQTFPHDRLHFVPVPQAIPRPRWLRTTIRIQHLAGLTDDRRRARFAKYGEADPLSEFQEYESLLDPPGPLERWEPRQPGLPVLLPPDESIEQPSGELGTEIDSNAPIISAIVISKDDEDRIERSVRSVVDQDCPVPFEVIVVSSGSDRTAEIVRDKFPQVALVELNGTALPGAARNAGLREARGDYVSFPGSHVELPQGSLAARVRAHQLGYPMVTGTVLNGTSNAPGWASYFLDHSTVLPGRPSEELAGAPAHCSYDREFLLQVGGFPENMRAGEDTVANERLAARGCVAYRAQEVVLVHHSPCRTVPRLLTHHFARGRALGRILLDTHRPTGRLLTDAWNRRSLIRYLPARLGRVSSHVDRWGGDLQPTYRRVHRYVVAGALAAMAGMWVELLRPRRWKARILFGRGVVSGAVSGRDMGSEVSPRDSCIRGRAHHA